MSFFFFLHNIEIKSVYLWQTSISIMPYCTLLHALLFLPIPRACPHPEILVCPATLESCPEWTSASGETPTARALLYVLPSRWSLPNPKISLHLPQGHSPSPSPPVPAPPSPLCCRGPCTLPLVTITTAVTIVILI